MVTFSEYTELAYEVAESKGFADQLRGAGTQEANQRFISELAEAYNANDHSEASRQAARRFLDERVGPP
jgi:hypothetical protein